MNEFEFSHALTEQVKKAARDLSVAGSVYVKKLGDVFNEKFSELGDRLNFNKNESVMIF